MSIRTALAGRVAQLFTSGRLADARAARAERARRRRGDPHRVEAFLQADDPHSHLLLQAAPLLAARHDVQVRPWLVGPPADWAAPERAMLVAHARTDAALLAARAGFSFDDPGAQPAPERVRAAEDALAVAFSQAEPWGAALAVTDALWRGEPIPVPTDAAGAGARAVAAGEAQRASLGHFMSATLFHGGEWHAGLDRLHHLERRLDALGARRDGAPAAPVFAPPVVPGPARPAAAGPAPTLHWYLSFRSPYTAIAAHRVRALAEAHRAPVRLAFVLPMVMRGLPVPRMKSRAFTLDAAREARHWGVPFGRIADPVGRPVERGYALLPWAIERGRGLEFVEAFLDATWAGGVDAGSDAGLRRIVEAAGLDWTEGRRRLGDEGWRALAEAHRLEMTGLGLWGVPSFRVGDVAVWGQDRLWVIDDALRDAP
jgi:2-hydroxychromene-2-carboxylate isomerase